MKIIIFGAGYVGLSLSVLISQKHEVILVDIDETKVNLINKKETPFNDTLINEYFKNKKLNLRATTSYNNIFQNTDYVIIATPTNYDPINNQFDTTSVESVINQVIRLDKNVPIVIKSTLPFGFTNKTRKKFNKDNIIFSPEFLRENYALYDNLFPSRVIVGSDQKEGNIFAKILIECAEKKDIPCLTMDSTEAEAVKLFSNTYLALRISFFNELDSFCEVNNIPTSNIIEGIGYDKRIGNYYNNPSFGYGGYCLPKDTKQLLNNFNDVPNNIIEAIVDSNKTRKKFIVNSIIKKEPKIVGIYKLGMKTDSDNFKESAVIDIIQELMSQNINIIIFEPLLKEQHFMNAKVCTSLDEFANQSTIILANRINDEIKKYSDKIYSRDIFNEN